MPTARSKLDDSDPDIDDDECDDGSSSDSSASSHGSGGTDTSDLDLEQCVRRKSDCVRQLCELERQFAVLKQQLFDEKVALLDARLAAVEDGTAVEYTTPLQRLDESYRQRQQTTLALRRLRLANCQHRYDSEVLAATQHLRSERSVLALNMRAEIQERLRRLEEDRRQVDVMGADMWCNGGAAVSCGGGGDGRGKRRGNGDSVSHRSRSPCDEAGKRKRRVTVSGPYIVYMLADADVMEDWTAIKKALSVSKRKGDFKILRDVHAMWGF